MAWKDVAYEFGLCGSHVLHIVRHAPRAMNGIARTELAEDCVSNLGFQLAADDVERLIFPFMVMIRNEPSRRHDAICDNIVSSRCLLTYHDTRIFCVGHPIFFAPFPFGNHCPLDRIL